MKWSLETVCNRGVTWVGQILKNDSLFGITTLAQPPIKDLFPVRLRTRENQGIAKEEPGQSFTFLLQKLQRKNLVFAKVLLPFQDRFVK